MEHDDVIDPVQKLRAEDAIHLTHHGALHRLVVRLLVISAAEPKFLRGNDLLRTSVRCHDDDRIAEINLPALRVCEISFIQHLQQHIEYVRMCFLDLIKQHDGVRVPPHLLGQLSALIVPDIAGRRADHFRDIELLHVLRHVDAYDILLTAEDRLRQRLRKLCLSDSGRSQKEK